MAKLNVDQRTIEDMLSDKKAQFLIPDYQRPYAWGDDECRTLWDDISAFAFPNDDTSLFNLDDDEYFLGAIVTFRNERQQLEVIDGQQRLTTILLILRAFYDRFEHMKDDNSVKMRERIQRCIWKTDEFGNADLSSLKIDSEVATDDDKAEFLDILRTGEPPKGSKSVYARNFRFFQEEIDKFLERTPSYFASLPARMLGNCILLPIETESQDTALRIFSTLNDRGLPLSDADIFKAQFYQYYGNLGKKGDFIEEWKTLEAITSDVFHPASGSPMDDLFARYMYYLRAREGNKNTTTESLRRFFERDKYALLRNESAMTELRALADFWHSVEQQDHEKFSEPVLKQLYVLKYSPNGMWEYLLSVYFLAQYNTGKLLESNVPEEQGFSLFLHRITAFTFAYAVTNPGVNALRTPAFAEMISILQGEEVRFEQWKFDETSTRAKFDNFGFTNQRAITRSILTLRMMLFDGQSLPAHGDPLDVEHIYSRKRQEIERGLSRQDLMDELGNKVLLERAINIRASDYRFDDKKRIYLGELRRGKYLEPTRNQEISAEIVGLAEFDEEALVQRDRRIHDQFFEYLRSNGLIADQK